MDEHPGPTALLRRTETLYEDRDKLLADIELAKNLVVRYAKKVNGQHVPQVVQVHQENGVEKVVAEPLADKVFTDWYV